MGRRGDRAAGRQGDGSPGGGQILASEAGRRRRTASQDGRETDRRGVAGRLRRVASQGVAAGRRRRVRRRKVGRRKAGQTLDLSSRLL